MTKRSKIRFLRAIYMASFGASLVVWIAAIVGSSGALVVVSTLGVIHFAYKTDQMFNLTENTFND